MKIWHDTSLSRRLIVYIVLCSSIITFLLSANQLYREYRADIEIINDGFEQIRTVHLKTIEATVWSTDIEKLVVLLEGLGQLRDIEYVAVLENGVELASVGEIKSTDHISNTYMLTNGTNEAKVIIGTMTVVANLNAAYERIFDKAIFILINNAIKTALVAGMMLLIIHRVVIRHLTSITHYFRDFEIGRSTGLLTLDRQPNPDAENDELDLMVNSINATNERDAQTFLKVQAAEDRTRDFAEASADWFWEMDHEFRYTYLSDRYEEIIGSSVAERLGHRRWDAADPDEDAEKWAQHIADHEAHRPYKNFEYTPLADNPARICLSSSGVPVFDADGNFTGYRGSTTDIRERKNLEERLGQSQKMETIGQLTGGVAHDFNNLLGVMLGNTEMLEEKLPDDEQTAHNIEALKNAVDRASSLTSRLLAFSRQQTLSPVSTDVTLLVNGLEEILRRTLGETVDTRVASNPDLWPATIDRHQFENALLNLAINARDAMPRGGRLTVETTNITLDAIYAAHVEDVTQGDYVLVAVSDTGSGISPDILDKVFDPFFTTKGVGEGSGLGLSMVYGFAKQSGGHVTIYSEVDQGTTIKLYLPRSTLDVVHDTFRDEAPDFDQGSERILIVEDDADVRKIPVKILQNQGYTVVEAENGAAAIERLNDGEAFDMIFTDVILPGGMNGVEVAEEARRIQPGIKVLYTTGYAETSVAHHGRLDPDETLVNKPYRRTELLEKVRATLEGVDA
jgi:PAS domain S-box-containing protein